MYYLSHFLIKKVFCQNLHAPDYLNTLSFIIFNQICLLFRVMIFFVKLCHSFILFNLQWCSTCLSSFFFVNALSPVSSTISLSHTKDKKENIFPLKFNIFHNAMHYFFPLMIKLSD